MPDLSISGPGEQGANQPEFQLSERTGSAEGRTVRHQHQVTTATGKVIKCFVATGDNPDINSFAASVLTKLRGYVRLTIQDEGTHQSVDILVKKSKLLGIGIDQGHLEDAASANQAFREYQTIASKLHDLAIPQPDLDHLSLDQLRDKLSDEIEMRVHYLSGGGNELHLRELALSELQGLYNARVMQGLHHLEMNSPELSQMTPAQRRQILDAEIAVRINYLQSPEADEAHLREMSPLELQGLYNAKVMEGLLQLGISSSELSQMTPAQRRQILDAEIAVRINYLRGPEVDETHLKELSPLELQGLYTSKQKSERIRYIQEITENSDYSKEALKVVDLIGLKHLSTAVRMRAGKLTAEEIAGLSNLQRQHYVSGMVRLQPAQVELTAAYHKDQEAGLALFRPIVPVGWAESLVLFQPVSDHQIDADLGRSTCQVGTELFLSNPQGVRAQVRADIDKHFEDLEEPDKDYLCKFILESLCETNTSAQAQGAVYETYGVAGGAIFVTPAAGTPIPKPVTIIGDRIRIEIRQKWELRDQIDPEHVYARVQTTNVVEGTVQEIIAWAGDPGRARARVTIQREEPPGASPLENDYAAAA